MRAYKSHRPQFTELAGLLKYLTSPTCSIKRLITKITELLSLPCAIIMPNHLELQNFTLHFQFPQPKASEGRRLDMLKFVQDKYVKQIRNNEVISINLNETLVI
jgi:hypothetical protein